MKKFVIYLLTLMMIFSPMTAFAVEGDPVEDEGQVPVEEMQDQDAEVPEEAAPADDAEAVDETAPAEAAEAVEEEAPAEAAVEEAVEAPAAQEAPLLGAGAEAGEEDDIYTWVEGTGYTKAEKNGEPAKGVFKAKRFKNGAVDGTSLFYADESGTVPMKEQLVTGSGYIHESSTEGEAWKAASGTYSYLVTRHDEFDNRYFVYWQKGLKEVNGTTYFVQDNGTVKTSAGVQTVDGAKYYIQNGGAVLKTVGFTPDHKYYIPKTDGKILTTQGTFKANDGKTYYAGAGGVIPSTAGLYAAGSNKYYVNADGSVKTDAGFITVGGKKYLVNNGGAIRNTAGPVSFGGNKYVAEAGGAIRTTKGFYKAGGKIYYITGSTGIVKVNKAFKVSGKSYHAQADGTIAVGVHKWKSYYYYSTSTGALRKKTGIVKWNNNYYHVKKTGKVTTNKKITYKGKTYIAKKSGAFFKRIFTWQKNKYYANSKGVLRTKSGLFKYDGNRYYSRKGGKLYRGTLFSAGGKKYLANDDARIQYGYLTWKGKHYLTNEKGAIYTKEGKYTYNKVEYFVKSGGAMANKEFVTYNDDHYYINADGSIAKKSFTYKKIKITPNSKTGIISLEDYWKVFPDEKPAEEQDDN